MKYPFEKKNRRRNKSIIEIDKYKTFNNLFVIIPKTISIGNATRIYRGSAENVPVEAGIRTASTENKMYESLTFFFHVM